MAAEAPGHAPHTPETRDDDAPSTTGASGDNALPATDASGDNALPATGASDGGGQLGNPANNREGQTNPTGGDARNEPHLEARSASPNEAENVDGGFGVGGRGAGGFSGHGWPLRAYRDVFTASPGAATTDTEAPDSSSQTEALKQLATHLEQLKPAPIDTVYLRYAETTKLEDAPLLGFEHPPHPWLIDRRTCGQPGWFGLAISAPGPIATWSRDELATWAIDLIARARPHWPAPLETVVIREKRATFSATPAAEHHRPPPGRTAPGLWLAGDHTATGLPATLEGAVRSGVQCAQHLLTNETS